MCAREREREGGGKMMFLILPRQGITPQILKPIFPVQTSGLKQKHK